MICASKHQSLILRDTATLKKNHNTVYNSSYSSLLFAPQINIIPLIPIPYESEPITYKHFTLHNFPNPHYKLRVIMNLERSNFIICFSGFLDTITSNKLIFNNGDVIYFEELRSNVYNYNTRRILTSSDVKNINILI